MDLSFGKRVNKRGRRQVKTMKWWDSLIGRQMIIWQTHFHLWSILQNLNFFTINITHWIFKKTNNVLLDWCRYEERLPSICSMYETLFCLVCVFTGDQGSIKLRFISMEFGHGLSMTRERGTYWGYMLNFNDRSHISRFISCKNVYRDAVSTVSHVDQTDFLL